MQVLLIALRESTRLQMRRKTRAATSLGKSERAHSIGCTIKTFPPRSILVSWLLREQYCYARTMALLIKFVE